MSGSVLGSEVSVSCAQDPAPLSQGNGAAAGPDPTRRELESKRAAENVAHKAEEQACLALYCSENSLKPEPAHASRVKPQMILYSHHHHHHAQH